MALDSCKERCNKIQKSLFVINHLKVVSNIYKLMSRNICLIGLPYAGKTFLSKKISQRMNMGYINTDRMIENYTNKKLYQILDNNTYTSINNFIKTESNIIKTLDCENCIIDPGGSVIYTNSAMEHIRNNLNAFIIYLDISYKTFTERITNIKDRGVVIKQGCSIKNLYNERTLLYKQYANKTVDANNIYNIEINHIINKRNDVFLL